MGTPGRRRKHCAHNKKTFQSNANHPLSSWVGVRVKKLRTCAAGGGKGGWAPYANKFEQVKVVVTWGPLQQTRLKNYLPATSLTGGNQWTLHVTDTNLISSRHAHYKINFFILMILIWTSCGRNNCRNPRSRSDHCPSTVPIHLFAWSAWTSTKILRQ